MSTQIDNFTVTEVNNMVSLGDTIPSAVLTLSPNPGYVITASEFSATIVPPVSSISFSQDGSNVLMAIDFSSAPVISDLSIPICMSGTAAIVQVNLQVDYGFNLLNANSSIPESTINISGPYNSTKSVFTSTISASQGYYFLNEPTCTLTSGNAASYAFTKSRVFDENSNLINITFSATYTFPVKDVVGDIIEVIASAVALPTEAPVVVRAYNFSNSPFNNYGETRRFIAIGSPGANWTLTVTNGATPSTYSSVIPSGGQDFVEIVIPPGFNEDYIFTLSGDLVNPFPQVNPFTISQAGDIPVLTTELVTDIDSTTATSGGLDIVTLDPVTEKGVEWSIFNDFSVIAGFTTEGSGSDDFISSITNLQAGTTYFVRAYAVNSSGTGYGQVEEFTSIEVGIPCGQATLTGYSGQEEAKVVDNTIGLSGSGGLITLLWNAAGAPDKLEIIHDGTKKATSNMNANMPSPVEFDNVYGTEGTEPAANVIPSEADVANIDQFIGFNKSSTIPTRQDEFTNATGYSVSTMPDDPNGQPYQQIIWWEYTAADYAANPIVTVRVTEANPSLGGTGWSFLRMCCPDGGNCIEQQVP